MGAGDILFQNGLFSLTCASSQNMIHSFCVSVAKYKYINDDL